MKAESPTYIIDQDKQLVVHYLHHLLNESEQKTTIKVRDLLNFKWKDVSLTNGDLLIMPGKNWFTFNLVNQQAFSQQVVIDIANQVRMSKVELFTLDIHNNLVQQAMHLQRSNNRSAKITVSAMSQLTLYVTIESASQLRSSVNIYSANEYIKAEHTSV
ncbi:hypothetical protein L3081_01315 [Colwellia sp. MSW7]|uniref:7TM-DISM receptor extracellular domain-containing protein n=1 Tax=Colwellia maritima TaxID=2912588 RepID=A0ABS9WWI8_9GAMM|nr:hypothetical protein [Colwellia maritima]